MTKMRWNRVAPAALAAVAALTLGACDRQTMDRADREGAEVGQKADAGLEVAKEKLEHAGRVAEQKLASAGDRTAQALDNAGEKTREGANTPSADPSRPATAESSSAAHTRGVISDTAITASIEADFLKDPDLSVLKIDVDTKDGVVTLNGLAKDEEARARAARIANNVKGVHEVRNYLSVKRG